MEWTKTECRNLPSGEFCDNLWLESEKSGSKVIAEESNLRWNEQHENNRLQQGQQSIAFQNNHTIVLEDDRQQFEHMHTSVWDKHRKDFRH